MGQNSSPNLNVGAAVDFPMRHGSQGERSVPRATNAKSQDSPPRPRCLQPRPADVGLEPSRPQTETQPKPTIKFVAINKPSGKGDRNSTSVVRSHVMRRYHDHRRARSQAAKDALAGPTSRVVTSSPFRNLTRNTGSSAGHHSCNHPPAVHVTSPQSAILPFEIGTSPGESSPIFSDEIPYIITSSSVTCTQCGRLLLHLWPRHGHMVLKASPYGVQSFTATSNLDPFASSVIPVTHRMHELIHYCRSVSSSWLEM